ncbi:adrenodoxin isoform X2 [Gymnodraco acuticeps]|uniref:Adrenodoxin isoform X2 n=1 Tax=Gymnodraco acuticeps TaxID=8218 RepID=A0A6P8UL34_GYMAC|nr:adrenodoxin isoform X2 [Gymnodraco acuticeps]
MALVTALRRLVRLREFAWRTAAVTSGSWPRTQSFSSGHLLRDGEKITVKGSPGDSLLDIVINEDLDFDGFGACEGTLACSTCHLIFEEETYKSLGPVTDEEMDMLDLAYGLSDTSRLGCQICLTKRMEGMVARVPESVADIRQSQDGS